MFVDPTDGLSDSAVSDCFTMLIFFLIVSVFLVEYSNWSCTDNSVVRSLEDTVDEFGGDNPSDPCFWFSPFSPLLCWH
jgi:hypothetical protein